MIAYGVVWHPHSDNLGDDLQALAAMLLTPRVDRVLDAGRLDAPQTGLGPEGRLVTLLSGNILGDSAHWPPDEAIAPVCVGLRVAAENVWGMHPAELDGEGLRYLNACAPIGCRDDKSAAALRGIGIPCDVTGCLTLTLEAPEGCDRDGQLVRCVDVPPAVTELLASRAPQGMRVVASTHQRAGDETGFAARMDGARRLVRDYASCAMVVTRRLHCAMVCLAVGTPVLLLYNSGYEDVTRFAPMDGMMRTQAVDSFVREVNERGFPAPWRNPEGVGPFREKLRARVAAGIGQAAQRPLPSLPPRDVDAWRRQWLDRTVDSAADKIRLLQRDQYEILHDKFSLLVKEDSVKVALTRLLADPDVRRALRRASRRRALRALPWPRRLPALLRPARPGPDEVQPFLDQLARLGWPEGKT